MGQNMKAHKKSLSWVSPKWVKSKTEKKRKEERRKKSESQCYNGKVAWTKILCRLFINYIISYIMQTRPNVRRRGESGTPLVCANI